jgi:eukaryotic-like serine/threonine-protein kinase
MSLAPGSRLGPYEILTPLGAGGMGEVYKAKDTRLDRLVAVKVLSEPLAMSGEALARFEREAKAVAALNHPNILAIHDFATHGEISYVVMELLEGESLRERLAQGPLAPRQATELAMQMADGLAAAHDKGIVHRDLKPENLWITNGERLKILDFGLAKQVGTMGAGTDSTAPTAAISRGHHTGKGTILGTLAYMSPEQVRGKSVDARSDLFSFGAVLFEMLTGRFAFARGSSSDTMAAILRDDPPQDLLAGRAISPGLQRVVLHCLEKEPHRRFQSAADLRFALESVLGDSSPRAAHVESLLGRKKRTRFLPAAAIGVLCLLLGAGLTWIFRGSPEPPPAVAIRLVTYSGHDTSPAVSPDGKTVAFTSDRDGKPRIWLKQLKGGGEVALTPGPDDFPRFSPDGTSVLFIHTEGGNTSLQRSTLLGNDPHKVVDDAEQADWSPDGKQIAFVRLRSRQDNLFSALYLIDAGGGTERELAGFEGELIGFPRWNPDGRHIIVNTPSFITSGVLRKLILVDVKDGSFREIRPESPGMLTSAAWASTDEIVFLQSESITAGGTAVSPARAFRENIRTRRHQELFWGGSSGATLDLFPDGRVIFDAMSGRQNLREYDLEGHKPPRWITHGTINDRQPVFAPGDDWVVFSSNRSGNLNLWAISTLTGVVRSITDDPADDWDPGISPDGRTLLWSSNRSGNLEIWASNLDGSGAHQVTHDGEDAQNPTQTKDGKWIVHSSANRKHPGLWKIHPDGSGAEQLAQGAIQLPEVSPDGTYATYMITLRTSSTLHVIRVEDGVDMTFAVLPEPRRKTSVFPCRARWTPDGKSILFTGQDERGLDGVFIQDFIPGKDTASTRRPLAGFDPDWITESLGLSSDGKRLVLSESERVFSLMIAEGVPGLERKKGSPR